MERKELEALESGTNSLPADFGEELNVMNIGYELSDMQKYVRSHEIFSLILAKIPEIPFKQIKRQELIDRDEITEKTEDKSIRVSSPEKYHYISMIFHKVSSKLNHNFTVLDGTLCYYNGCYWELVDKNVVMDLLALVAEKAGMPFSLVQQHKVKISLFNQFVSTCNTPPFEVDTKKILINMKNGTLDMTSGKPVLKAFDKNDMIRYQLSFEYNPEAACPQYDKFINRVLSENEAQWLLMEMLGYCFIPTKELKLETAMILFGDGQNGKGVIYELVKEILGRKHVTGFSMQALSYDANARAQLSGKLLNYASELGGKCNADMIKKLISGEDVEVKTLYKDMDMLKDYSCKLMFNTNSLPKETESNTAFFRRWAILPFNAVISDKEKDVKLPEKLKQELPGIFNLVVMGIIRLRTNEHFTESQLAKNELAKYRLRSDTVLQFIKGARWIASTTDNGERKGSEIPHVVSVEFYRLYSEYCKNVLGSHPCNSSTFYERIKKMFYIQQNCTRNETWIYCKKEVFEEHKTSSEKPAMDFYNRLTEKRNEEKGIS